METLNRRLLDRLCPRAVGHLWGRATRTWTTPAMASTQKLEPYTDDGRIVDPDHRRRGGADRADEHRHLPLARGVYDLETVSQALGSIRRPAQPPMSCGRWASGCVTGSGYGCAKRLGFQARAEDLPGPLL